MFIKCKCCGENLEVKDGLTQITCPVCLTKQSLPNLKLQNEVLELFNKANTLRRNSNFDEAIKVYEEILKEAPNDSEAYFGIFLSTYGILYVKDPRTAKMVPTCNRLTSKNILEDKNYLNALKYASSVNKDYYLKEAKEISRILKVIYKMSEKEEAYDLFISYKDSDDKTCERTEDSLLAEKLYNLLKEKGFKVFFSRITLENTLGEAYEPIIYHALRTSRVLITVSTKKDYINAPWVKNEWSRYLSFIKEDNHKYLIPCYKNMSLNELPEELKVLQCQDLNKVGAYEDLLRGIDKIFLDKIEEDLEMIKGSSNHVKNAIKRINICLEGKAFSEALRLSNILIDEEPDIIDGYLLKICSENNLSKMDLISDNLYKINPRKNLDFKSALAVARGSTKQKLLKYLSLADDLFYNELKSIYLGKDHLSKESIKEGATYLENLKDSKYYHSSLDMINYELTYNETLKAIYEVLNTKDLKNLLEVNITKYQELIKKYQAALKTLKTILSYSKSLKTYEEALNYNLKVLKESTSIVLAFDFLSLLESMDYENYESLKIELENKLTLKIKESKTLKSLNEVLNELNKISFKNNFIKKTTEEVYLKISDLFYLNNDYYNALKVIEKVHNKKVNTYKEELINDLIKTLDDDLEYATKALNLINLKPYDDLTNIKELRNQIFLKIKEVKKKDILRRYQELYSITELNDQRFKVNYTKELHDKLLDEMNKEGFRDLVENDCIELANYLHKVKERCVKFLKESKGEKNAFKLFKENESFALAYPDYFYVNKDQKRINKKLNLSYLYITDIPFFIYNILMIIFNIYGIYYLETHDKQFNLFLGIILFLLVGAFYLFMNFKRHMVFKDAKTDYYEDFLKSGLSYKKYKWDNPRPKRPMVLMVIFSIIGILMMVGINYGLIDLYNDVIWGITVGLSIYYIIFGIINLIVELIGTSDFMEG